MKILYYLLSAICALIGLLGLARAIEVFALGGGIRPVQIFIAVIAFALGWFFLNKARRNN